ncbi:phosphopentomutase/phosphoglucosamine mutase [Fervidicoccus fontis]|uniref:Phosphoglucomutase n=1 Tax=Fervidicoccus fontis TaxID=683846 RepID=A0A2J6N989_9CREN|nr:phosphopentomutase/phosphoglucosamine mutase [Fervidicoccus fontis]PMB75980.1 MAG: phosphoglucomutase [Fervidicoccus fontis]PMB77867.1 MAG: phosphoglucomutase [Fervidicoccus fontis]HEW63571.1 phosphopentomutase/phosphoglucosamine mutase [Fervidicoccus fontis]
MSGSSRLFGTDGIRGKYLEKVKPGLAYDIGLAVAAHVGGRGTITIGHDIRTTSPLLALSAGSGAMSGGTDAIFLGMVPTPVLAYSVPHTKSKAGIMITASHNPPPDNGIKVFQYNGMEYTERMEDELERIIQVKSEVHASWDQVGRLINAPEIGEDYVDELSYMMSPRTVKYVPRVYVDCSNGAASNYTPRLLRKMGAKVFSANCHPDGYFPAHEPEPRQDVLEPLINVAQPLSPDVILAHDGDADRLSALTIKRGFIKQDHLIALYAKEKLLEGKGTIIVSVDVGNSVSDIVEKYGGRLVRAKLGKLHEKLLEYPGALFAAEPWKLIDPKWGMWVDGIYQAIYLTKLMMEEGLSLDGLLSDIPCYPWARISIPIINDGEKKRELYMLIEENILSTFDGYKTLTKVDGIRLDFDDKTWFLIRMSGTEPKIRLYAEAPTTQKLEELVDKLSKIINEISSKLGVKLGNYNVNKGT